MAGPSYAAAAGQVAAAMLLTANGWPLLCGDPHLNELMISAPVS